ncbi:MAG TPA: acetyl-CoA C-acyltransferase, partial [Myxococcaceae bacterium]|nr:acetyl-CoA C-acyltransferase [Myxococcaceae bacterium]
MKSVSTREEIWFLAGKRTAFGTFGGALKDWSATDLAVATAKAALAAANVSPEDVEHVVYGN